MNELWNRMLAAWDNLSLRERALLAVMGGVAGAMVLASHGIAGIYWVATLAESRGRGYGEAVTRAVANDAFQRGADAVVLQASPFGEPVYRRIGFREITRYHWYMVA